MEGVKATYTTRLNGTTVAITHDGVFGFDRLQAAVEAEAAWQGLKGEAAEAAVAHAMWMAVELTD